MRCRRDPDENRTCDRCGKQTSGVHVVVADEVCCADCVTRDDREIDEWMLPDE